MNRAEQVSIATRSLRILEILTFVIFVFLVQKSTAQGTNNVLTVPAAFRSSPLVGTGNFNALVFGNFTSNSGDVEGRLVVGNNFDYTDPASSYSVGIAGPGLGSVNAPGNTDNLIVNGNFNNASNDWQIEGNFVYNTSTPGITMPVPSSGITNAGISDRIVFSGGVLLANYQQLSTQIDALATNGVVSQPHSYDPITLNGTNSTLNVFDVTLPALHDTGFEINVPAGSTVVVNISNANINISGGNMTVNGLSIPGAFGAGSNVLFNFPNATQISMDAFGLLASVLAPMASLDGNGGSINGQGIIGGNLNQTGGFEFHNFDFTGDLQAVLPVVLVKFEVITENSAIVLRWTTASETNSSLFEVEHSLGGKKWDRIGTVTAYGESSTERNYYFTDQAALAGENLYRLKMIDNDQTFSYSRIQSARIDIGAFETVIYPNPVVSKVYLKNIDIQEIKEMLILNAKGESVYKTSAVAKQGIDVADWVNGLYFIRVTNAAGDTSTHKLMISK